MKNWEENIFPQTIGCDTLWQDNNDNGVRIVNFATSKNIVNSMMFPYRNIHKNTGPDNQIDHILINWRSIPFKYTWFTIFQGEMTVILITMQWLQNLGKN
jgi:hypothetical protein